MSIYHIKVNIIEGINNALLTYLTMTLQEENLI